MKPWLLPAAVVLHLAVSAQNPVSFFPAPAPVVFAPGLVSNGFDNRDMALSPAGDEMFFTLQSKQFSVILTSRRQKGGQWSTPEVAPFSGRFKDLEAAFSPDGKQLFFASARPLSDTGTAPKDFDIWCVKRSGEGWAAPFRLSATVNTEKDEYYPSVARSGNLYFTRDNGATKEDIFVARSSGGTYTAAEALPAAVNAEGYDFNAFVDPDEAFILFTSYKRSDDRGGGDLYASMKKDGRWQPARNLGGEINSTSIDYCPFVSFDKKHFFFTSKRTAATPSVRMDRAGLQARLLSAGNGSDDVYVVDFSVLKNLLTQ